MSDEEYDSSSEEDDEDYVPDEEELSEDEDEVGSTGNKGKQNTVKQKPKRQKRKRKRGIKLDDEEEEEEEEEEEKELDKEQEELRRQKEEDKKKSKIEDLWASFKQDTAAVRPNKTTAQTSTGSSKTAKPTASRFTSPAQKVTITQTFDFAGEEVKVTKTVDADSKEAKKATHLEQEGAAKPPQPGPSIGVKRPGGLGSVLGSLGKKPKISTLEKSKIDWMNFKDESGISEELQHHNKDGYLEKQAFLSRTDWNRFEREKAMRNIMRKST